MKKIIELICADIPLFVRKQFKKAKNDKSPKLRKLHKVAYYLYLVQL